MMDPTAFVLLCILLGVAGIALLIVVKKMVTRILNTLLMLGAISTGAFVLIAVLPHLHVS
jgi:hypothetical protein